MGRCTIYYSLSTTIVQYKNENWTSKERSRKEYLNILKNRGIKISSNISTDKLLRKVKFFKKADFRYIADTRGANKTDDMSTDDLIKAIYTHLHKKKQDTITEILKELELTNLAERQNISTHDVDEIRRLNNMSHNDLKKIAKLRNIIKYGTLSREDLVYTLIRSEKAPHENNYMKYIQNNEIEKIKDKIKDKIKIIKIKLLKLEIIIKKNCKILPKKKKKTYKNTKR